jgi:uncharacterized protein YggU (UPF0235/DUF167 family)
MTGLPVRDTGRGVRLELRVIPRSPKTSVAGIRNGRILVRVTAPPVDRAANAAVVGLVADLLEVPRGAVRVAGGAASRNKVVDVDGVDCAHALAKLVPV